MLLTLFLFLSTSLMAETWVCSSKNLVDEDTLITITKNSDGNSFKLQGKNNKSLDYEVLRNDEKKLYLYFTKDDFIILTLLDKEKGTVLQDIVKDHLPDFYDPIQGNNCMLTKLK